MLSILTLEQSEKWDETVRSFRNYDVYWLSGYVKAFQIHGDGEPLLFVYEDETVRGINLVMKRDIAKDTHFRGLIEENKYYDFATPYGYGGWIIEGDQPAPLFEAYNQWAVNNGIVSEFVRFHPMLKNHINCKDYYQVVELGEVVHIDLISPESIWENFSGKNRNVIRKAMKNDVRIYNGRFPQAYEQFVSIYNETMDKDRADDYYYFQKEFYDSLLNDLPQNAQVFFAEKDGVVIASSIMLAANGRMNYHLSGSRREYSHLAATNLLLYQAALWGYENGCRTLYLGGGVGSGNDNLFKFKRAFNKGNLNHFYIGKKIHDREMYDWLTSMRNVTGSSFFPEYRADSQ